MATPNVGILTTAGKTLIDKVNSGQAKISFSKVVFSSMDNSQLSDMQVKALTAIAPQEVVVSSPETTLDTNSGETRIRATGTNEKLADGVYVKTYGVFAKDDKGSEILYGVTVSPNPNYFPAYDGVTPQAVTYSYKTVIQETSNITMTNSNDVYASQEDLTEAIQPYAKTVDVNQQLDKKVNVSDMRKPASDVAGIEEVNAKQDKIGYTPADDSKVVHTTDTSNWQKQAMFNPGDFKIDVANSTTDFATLLRSKYNKGGIVYIRENEWPVINAVVICEGSGWWYAYGVTIDGNFVHRQIRTTDDTGWVTNADDSKVAHLSGANNFDTVPTVNNNPLLLASSLPSDLARTSQQTNFTAGLKSGGVDVATAADLKSIEASAWRQLDNKYVTCDGETISSETTFLFRIDQTAKRLYFQGVILASSVSGPTSIYIDFSSVVKTVSLDTSHPIFYFGGNLLSTYQATVVSNKLRVATDSSGMSLITTRYDSNGAPYITYDELV